MNDRGKIYSGLVAFIFVVTFPFWFNLARGTSGVPPELELPVEETECVESLEVMRSSHMDLLNQWRDSVVRDGKRIYRSTSCRKYEMNLSNTCMGCHVSKVNFCDRCHNYLAVKEPYCWDCHVEPAEPAVAGGE